MLVSVLLALCTDIEDTQPKAGVTDESLVASTSDDFYFSIELNDRFMWSILLSVSYSLPLIVEIFVKMVDTCRIYALSVKSSSSVQELKQLIYDVDDIPPDKQYLTFACKPLDDYRQISNYSSTQPGVAFAVSLHLLGGMDEMDDGIPAVEPPVALALSPAAAPGIVAGAADTSNDAEPPAAFFRTYTFQTHAHDRSVVVESNGIVLGAGPPPGQVALSEDRMAANLASHLCRCEPLVYELSCRGERGAFSSLQSAVEQMAN